MVTFLKNNALLILLGIVGIILWIGDPLKMFTDLFTSRTDVEVDKDSSDTYLTQSQAEVIAENLYNAMASMGTDEAEIFKSFERIKSDSDYNMVYNSFGLRLYSETWGNGGTIGGLSERYNLTQWLTKELSVEEQAELQEANPEINLF